MGDAREHRDLVARKPSSSIVGIPTSSASRKTSSTPALAASSVSIPFVTTPRPCAIRA